MSTTITDRAAVATHMLRDAITGRVWARGTNAKLRRRQEEEARDGNFDLQILPCAAYRDAGGPWYER